MLYQHQAWCMMLYLSRFGIQCAARPPPPKCAAYLSALLPASCITRRAHASLRTRARAYGTVQQSAEEVESSIRPPVDAPYFPIYYNDVYEVDLPPGHRFPMGKYRKVREAVQSKVGSLTEEEKRRVHCEFHVSPLATKDQLITTHDVHYVHRYLTGDMTQLENRNIGFPWSPQGVNRTLSSVGGTVAAACAAWEEYLCRHEYLNGMKTQQNADVQPWFLNEKNKHLCWAAHVAGGTHHAFKDYGEGFCIFSDIAVAANVLLQRYSPSAEHDKYSLAIRRILIIDCDVHQGNGNAALFENEDRVQTFSMHCSGNYFSKKEASDLDVELPIGCDDGTYLSTLQHWLKRIEQHQFDGESLDVEQDDSYGSGKRKQFDLIFFQSGVDIHRADRLGRLDITQAGISKRNKIVFDFAHRMECPLVISMGGGYPNSGGWKPIIDAHAGVYWEAHQYLSKKH